MLEERVTACDEASNCIAELAHPLVTASLEETYHAKVACRGAELPAKYVIHTVGPVYDAQPPEESAQLLSSAYRCRP